MLLVASLMITLSATAQIEPPTTPSYGTIMLGGVEIKDQTNPNFIRVKVKNMNPQVVQIQFCYNTIPIVYDLQPGQNLHIHLPQTLVEMIVLIPVQISKENWEYERHFGLMQLTKNKGLN
jgi:hypothetical protein